MTPERARLGTAPRRARRRRGGRRMARARMLKEVCTARLGPRSAPPWPSPPARFERRALGSASPSVQHLVASVRAFAAVPQPSENRRRQVRLAVTTKVTQPMAIGPRRRGHKVPRWCVSGNDVAASCVGVLVGCASRMPCRREVGLRSNRPSVHILSGCGSRRNGSDTHQVRPSDERTHEDRDHHMFIIGIERHKLSHTAVAVDSFRDPLTRSASMRVAISADFCSSRRRGSSHAPGPSRERGDGCDTRPPARRCRRARGRCATVVAGSGAAVGAAAAGPCRPRRHGPPPPRRRLPRRRHRRLRPESS